MGKNYVKVAEYVIVSVLFIFYCVFIGYMFFFYIFPIEYGGFYMLLPTIIGILVLLAFGIGIGVLTVYKLNRDPVKYGFTLVLGGFIIIITNMVATTSASMVAIVYLGPTLIYAGFLFLIYGSQKDVFNVKMKKIKKVKTRTLRPIKKAGGVSAYVQDMPKQCPRCKTTQKGSAKVCTECGWEFITI